MPVFLYKPKSSKAPMTVTSFKAKHLQNYFCLIKHNEKASDNLVYDLTFVKGDKKKDDRFVSPNGEFHFKWSDVLAYELNNKENLINSTLDNDKFYTITLHNGLTNTLQFKSSPHSYKDDLFISKDGTLQLSRQDISSIRNIE